MAADIWGVLTEAQRLPWSSTPLESVGPLRPGMTYDQTQAAVRGFLPVAVSQGPSGTRWATFWLERSQGVGLRGRAVTAYYDESIGPAGVAVDPLHGPQLSLEGIRLVEQTPLTPGVSVHGLPHRAGQGAALLAARRFMLATTRPGVTGTASR
jgi:hypothetical protein